MPLKQLDQIKGNELKAPREIGQKKKNKKKGGNPKKRTGFQTGAPHPPETKKNLEVLKPNRRAKGNERKKRKRRAQKEKKNPSCVAHSPKKGIMQGEREGSKKGRKKAERKKLQKKKKWGKGGPVTRCAPGKKVPWERGSGLRGVTGK